MHEAAVELQMAVDVPKRVVPMIVVQMGVAPEHLLDDALHVRMVVWRESRRFTNPVVLVLHTGQL